MRKVRGIKYKVLGISLLLFISLSFKGDPQKSAVEIAINAFVNDPALKNAGIGFCMKEVESGALVYQYNSQQSLVPASTLKIVTTYAALEVLGEDYTFKTVLGYSGNIDSTDTLRGNIIVIGGGDPTLGSGRIVGTNADALIKTWIAAIKNVGIKGVSGTVISDATRYDEYDLPRKWPMEDIGNYYGVPASALSFGENYYEIDLVPGKKIGDKVELIQTYPTVPFTFTNQLTTGPAGSGDNAYVIIDNFGSHYLQGTIPLGKEVFSIKGAHYNPPLLFKRFLEDELCSQTFRSYYKPADTVILMKTVSPSLTEIVRYANLNSINLYAENLLRELGYVDTKGKSGTTENGVNAVMRILKEQGVNTSGVFMVDGCGLSRSNGVSASFLTDVLQKGYSSKAFYNSLPVAGQSGAMKNMGKGTAIDGNMHAKTGHMERVRSYAGYVKGKDGKMYSFALIVNNYSCESWEIKQKIEKVLVAIGN